MKKPELNTELDKKLYEVIQPIAKKHVAGEDAFINGVFLWSETQEERQKLLDYIIEHEITDDQDVMEIQMCMADGVEPEFIE